MIIGVDKGSMYTKTSMGTIFKSVVREITDELNNIDTGLVVEMDNKKYLIGNDGAYSTDLKKAEHDNTELFVYTAIAKSFDEEIIQTNLVLGLPIGLYSRSKEKMKELFSKKTFITISIEGIEKDIYIKNVEVFPEAAATYYMQNEKDCLIIDIGGLSVDIAYFKDEKLIKYSTYSLGTLKLLTNISKEINTEYDLSFNAFDVEDVIADGLYIYGEKKDFKTESFYEKHVKTIIDKIKLEYDIKAIRNITFTGGGSLMLFDYFKPYTPQATLLQDSIYSNAKGFELIGEKIFKES